MASFELPKKTGRFGATLLLLIAGAAVAYAMFRLFGDGFDGQRFLRGVRGLHLGYVALGLLLVFLTYVGRAVRWRVIIAPQRPDASLWGLFRSTIIGFTAITLFGRAGEIVRPFLIARGERLTLASQLAAWFLERIYDLLAVLIIFGIALVYVKPRGPVTGGLEWVLHTGGYLVAGLGMVCVALLVATTFFREGATRRIHEGLEVIPAKYRSKLENVLNGFAGGMESSRQWNFVGQIVLVTIVEWGIMVAANYALFRAQPATAALSLTDTLVFLGFVAFGGVLQLPGIGGGTQVAGVFVLTQLFNLHVEDATVAALLLWISMYVVVVPLGLVFAVQQGLHWKSLRQIKVAESEEVTTT